LTLRVIATAVLLVATAVYADKEPQFTPIRHASFVIQSDQVTIFVDPVDTDAFKKFSEPDIILVTDIHGDHLKPDVIAALRAKDTVVIGPKAVTEQIDDGTTLANGKSKQLGDTTVEAIPMYNLTEERLKFHEKGRGNGYVVTLGGNRIYISGDTEDIPEMRALEDIDYAFVCMNLPYTMTVEQAASAVLEMKPRVVYPYHYRGSDMKKFAELVGKDKDIEIRQLDWYE
jgi:L-ascorbate metabolism protein UlaG (beta-lactamase superfamily)